MKCEICEEREAVMDGFYSGERVNGCKTCLVLCTEDEVYYDRDEVYKCFMCGQNKHETHYHYHTDDVCRSCKEKIAEDDNYFPQRPVDV